jgi:glycosyltransferase involved in cell wall biosynthesis
MDQISVLILTYNEAPNIRRTLDALLKFSEVIVLDSGSTDETCNMAASYSNVRIEHRSFDQHANQWNYGLERCGIDRPWVLALDADYVLQRELVEEISRLPNEPSVSGYRVAFSYCIDGVRLSSALYPPVVVLYRRAATHYVQEGHTQRAVVAGCIRDLRGRINHDDRKPLSRWLMSQQRYARIEADYLLSADRSRLRLADRIRLMGWPAPFLVLVYTAIFKLCILSGWRGWLYVLQRVLAEIMIALEIVDRRTRSKSVE